ncbi:DUF2628 domain-containing protein [Aureimonas pseudogalii]|uniref:DUF2628 domain-containing protein n=1 Tax=Aureimonas pseudogalii TaxID=1744844 RepID=A0A7W6H4P6_9HYPH|nr:DUF2628 domain-containing protein [Aureimonas pseudogalii]MBB3997594.1 hypothetical protein [Aureimonas pseudogalii]
MTRWVVLEPASEATRSDRAVFVRDGFRPFAVVIPALWLLRHRLWWPAVAVVLFDLAVASAAGTQGFGLPAAALPLLVGLLVALEGPTLRLRRYRAQGWREAAVVAARGRRDAEALYFAGETAEPVDTLPAAIKGAEPLSGPSVRRAPGRTLFDGART